MKIEICDTKVSARTVKAKDGKEYTFYTQEGFYHDGVSPYPVRCVVPVDSLSSAYPVGWYTLSDKSLYVDKYGNISLARRFHLVSVE